MFERFLEFIADAFSSLIGALRRLFYSAIDVITAARVFIVAVVLFAAAGYAMVKHPPIKTVARGEIGIRLNRLTGTVDEWPEGSAIAIPGVHDVRIFSLRDQVYR